MTEPVDPAVEAALRMRASDADRERVAGLLRDAYAEGRLSPVEHDERLSAVYRAQTYGELVPVLHDLPVPRGTLAVPVGNEPVALVGQGPVGRGSAVDPSRGAQAEGNAAAVFGGVQRKGRWVVPAHFTTTCVFGGGELDFSEAVLTAQETELQVVCVFGGVQVKVPPGLAVRTEVTAIFGGADGPRTDAPPGSPLLRVTGVVLFGGVQVERTKPRPGADELPPA